MNTMDFKLIENSMKHAKVLDLTIEATVESMFIYSGDKIIACCTSVEEVYGWLQCYARERGKKDECMSAIYGEVEK